MALTEKEKIMTNRQLTALEEHGKKCIIGKRRGITFFECPIYGDEEPLIALYKNVYFCSGFFDMPSDSETVDLISSLPA